MSEKTNFAIRFVLFAMLHSLFATNRAKKILHGTNRRGYRLCYNLASLALFGWVMSAGRHSDVLYVAPGTWSLIMYLLQLAVGAALVSCLRQTGAGEFLGLAEFASGSFTCSGWYSIVRHPLYFLSILFMALNPVMTSQWLMLTILSAAYFVIGGLIEEKRLVAEFGETYRHYQQCTPFIIPSLARLKPHTAAKTTPYR